MRSLTTVYRVTIGILFSLLLTGCPKPGEILPEGSGERRAIGNLPPAPVIKAFSDSKYFMLVEDMVYNVEEAGLTIVVPQGFVTDFASVPKALWSFGMSPHERFSRAAIIHDYLYWAQVCTRAQADNIMLLAMKESGVSLQQQLAMFQGVNLGGGASWEENRLDRLKGLPRIVPTEYLQLPAAATWEEYETVLVEAGIKDPQFEENPEYCRLGDSSYSEHFNHFTGK